ncbi:MAG: class I SAM-dependent methyltransferase [Armatimonadetes bacterium]|nr:class I SAM-dependent methyltransferase [Armatimonadota bacterium]
MPTSLSFRRKILRLPIIGTAIVALQRLGYAAKVDLRFKRQVLKWLFTSREKTNITYDLSPQSVDHLAAAVAAVTGITHENARRYIDELEADDGLRRHIREATLASGRRYSSDLEARFGRRAGWYAVVRATKPKIIVETGVDKGLGSVVLAAALLRNREEGHEGRHYGTDIDPGAGFLISGEYAEVAETIYGDSIESLTNLDATIDLFINDSDHSAEYEALEYVAVAGKLADRALILGDNAHVTDKLLTFARSTGRKFLYFGEIPADHWHRGGGIGFAYRDSD